jgi:hypothetical protein
VPTGRMVFGTEEALSFVKKQEVETQPKGPEQQEEPRVTISGLKHFLFRFTISG